MYTFDEKYKILDELITYAKSKISIRNFYIDRRFFTVKCIDTLYQQKVKWLMPAVQNKAIQKLIKENTTYKIFDYVMGDTRYQHDKFKLAIVNDQENVKRLFATNLRVTEDNAKILFREYGKRWGIETSYRVKQDFKARTISKKYVVRLFYFMFSACLYNLWILANIMVGLALLKIHPERTIHNSQDVRSNALHTLFLS